MHDKMCNDDLYVPADFELLSSKKLTHRAIMWFYSQVLRPHERSGIIILLVLATILVSWSGFGKIQAAVQDDTIRIAIVKSAPEITVAGDGIVVTNTTGESLSLSIPALIKPVSDGLMVDGQFYKKLSFSSETVVYINNKPYRGSAELSLVDKGILVVNQLPLEEYLVGLINCEISSSWPIEAVKSQAIIARTYAVNRRIARMGAPYHMESSVIDQVYDGSSIEDSRARRAVQETEGEVLTYGGGVIQAYYHSSCGGRTEASENVWGAPLPYLKGVECQYCFSSPTATAWEYKITLKDLEDRLRAGGYKISGLTAIKPGIPNGRGRLKQVLLQATVGSTAVTGDQFRKVVGYGLIKSTRFTVTPGTKKDLLFSGTGNGHGVGLCQWGAKQRAVDGFTSGEILAYYYPGAELKKLSDMN